MKRLVSLLLLPLFAALVSPSPSRAADLLGSNSTNSLAVTNLIIFATNGGFFSASSAVFRGSVQVLEAQMYLECELLTISFDTNRADRPSLAASPAPTNQPADSPTSMRASTLSWRRRIC